MANDIGYDSKAALANKLIKEDGTVTDFAGNPVIGAVVAYDNKPALPNKWLNPDGTISTLAEIVTNMIDNDIFLIVDELPEEGVTDKVYLVVQDNKLIEYLWTGSEWDPVGMVEFDITNYYTKTEATALIAASLETAKAYADSKASAAETNAKNYAKDYTDSVATTVETNANEYTDTKATAAVASAKAYTDTQIQQKITQVLGGSY